MLRNADYIYNNIIIADEVNTTKKYCKKAQVGVDLSLAKVLKITSAGIVLKDKTKVSEYEEIKTIKHSYENQDIEVWSLPKGTYIAVTNEGTQFGPNDTGYVIQRSSLNRCGVTLLACVFDPGFTTRREDGSIESVSMRIIVENENGVYIEKNARIGQMIIFENESCNLYNGQYQGGRMTSKLIKENK